MMQEEGQVTGHGKEGVWVETQRPVHLWCLQCAQ